MKTLYTAEALASGEGRDGNARTKDGKLDVTLASPVELGGNGQGTNPEQLFAAGYAACFHSALQTVARAQKVSIVDSSVGARVQIGSNGEGGFGLAVQLEVVIPDLPHEQAVELANAAHQVCPYSNATRGNIDVDITVSDD